MGLEKAQDKVLEQETISRPWKKTSEQSRSLSKVQQQGPGTFLRNKGKVEGSRRRPRKKAPEQGL
jgi:hypothetical protein